MSGAFKQAEIYHKYTVILDFCKHICVCKQLESAKYLEDVSTDLSTPKHYANVKHVFMRYNNIQRYFWSPRCPIWSSMPSSVWSANEAWKEDWANPQLWPINGKFPKYQERRLLSVFFQNNKEAPSWSNKQVHEKPIH